jgi:uncharacterized protein involved in type VI secretion and phage assembly
MSILSGVGVVSSARLRTAAGADVFRLVEMRYAETVATPFTMVLDLVSEQTDLDPDSLLGNQDANGRRADGGGGRPGWP